MGDKSKLRKMLGTVKVDNSDEAMKEVKRETKERIYRIKEGLNCIHLTSYLGKTIMIVETPKTTVEEMVVSIEAAEVNIIKGD